MMNDSRPESWWSPTPWPVSADAVLSGVPDDLHQHLGVGGHDGLEVIGGQAETHGERRQDRSTDLGHGVHPGGDDGCIVGHGARPLVRAPQSQPRRGIGPEIRRGAFGADVDLVAPVAGAVGVLLAEAGVAPEVRRVGVDDLEAVGFGQARRTRRPAP